LVAFGTYKFSTRDADRIQEHTGTDPEEMDDAELEQAMQDLNIDPQKVTSDDVEKGSQATAAAPAASSGGSGDYLDELSKLAVLHDSGVLTDAEFAAQKKQILDAN